MQLWMKYLTALYVCWRLCFDKSVWQVQAAQRADTDTLRSIMPTLKVMRSESI